MHDLELARLIHADRERELERELRVRAFRAATRALDEESTFIPPPADAPVRIAHAIRLDPSPRRG